MEEKTITCIMCPVGCKIRITGEGKTVEIKGAACDNGKEYVLQEISVPSRVIMSVLPCRDGDIPTITVKTSHPVPKQKIRLVMKKLSTIEVSAPVHVGDIIVRNIADMHIDIIATRSAKKIP